MTSRRCYLPFCVLTIFLAFNGCSRERQIVGKWRDRGNANQTMRFLKDGTFITTRDGSSVSGRYRFADDNHILFETNTAEGPATSVLEYKLSGNELTFTFRGDVKVIYEKQR